MTARKAMLLDITLCVGCGACQAACKQENKLPEEPEARLSPTAFYWAEMLLGAVVPALLLARAPVRRDRRALFLGVLLVVLGFVLDRLNVSLTGFEAWAGRTYFPSWIEISVTLSIVTVGFIAFALAARHLPIFAVAPVEMGEAVHRELARDLRRVSLEA